MSVSLPNSILPDMSLIQSPVISPTVTSNILLDGGICSCHFLKLHLNGEEKSPITPEAALSMAIQPVHEAVNHLSKKLDALVSQIENFESSDRQWVDIKNATHVFGVPSKTIKLWAAQGFVRKSKLGPTFQSKTLYSAEDISDVLCRSAIGKSPRNALRDSA